MSELLGIGAGIGVILPLIVSFLKRSHWPTWANMGITVIICLAAGTITSAINGDISLEGDMINNPNGLLTAASAAFVSATVVYKTFFIGSQLDDTLTSIGSR